MSQVRGQAPVRVAMVGPNGPVRCYDCRDSSVSLRTQPTRERYVTAPTSAGEVGGGLLRLRIGAGDGLDRERLARVGLGQRIPKPSLQQLADLALEQQTDLTLRRMDVDVDGLRLFRARARFEGQCGRARTNIDRAEGDDARGR